MILPKRKHIQRFEGYTAADFAAWLESGLFAYFSKKPEVSEWAFKPLDLFIGQDEDLVFDLKNIFDVLPDIQKPFFRKAVADVLNCLEASKKNIGLFEKLLGLTRVLSAKSEILRVLAARVGNGYFGLLEGSDGESLFQTTLLTVAELAVESNEAVQCLNTLIKSNNFDCAYAGIALDALCRADAANFPDHMELLRQDLNEMFHPDQTADSTKRLLAKNVLTSIGQGKLLEVMPELVLCEPPKRGEANDNWLANALFKGDAPLILQKTYKKYEKLISKHEAELLEKVTIASQGVMSHTRVGLLVGPRKEYMSTKMSTKEKIDIFCDNYSYVFRRELNPYDAKREVG